MIRLPYAPTLNDNDADNNQPRRAVEFRHRDR